MTVAIVKYSQTPNAMQKAIEMVNGFEKLRPHHKVLVKPNISWGLPGDTSPSTGLVVSKEIVEQLIMLLRDFGCKDITIGEGSVASQDLHVDTTSALAWSGVDKLAERLGVKLIDLNKDEWYTEEVEGVKLEISKTAHEADFFINVGLLRTHFMTMFSGGMKNLKGCISMQTKKDFHRFGKLDHCIALLQTRIRTDLMLVDALYAQQQAPSSRRTHHTDLLLASKDVLENDVVCASLVGLDPHDVPHLIEYNKITGRSLDLDKVEVIGERVADVKMPMPYLWDWTQDFTTKYNIKGFTIGDPKTTMCSACSTAALLVIQQFMKANRGATFNDIDMCIASAPVNPKAKKVVLMGKCAIDAQKGKLTNAVKIGGCPPAGDRVRLALEKYSDKIAEAPPQEPPKK